MIDQTKLIARTFARSLLEDLGEDKMRQVIELNAVEPSGSGVCHSHDFCDANMNMAYAFEQVLGREPDVGCEEDAAVWNAAWAIAVAECFAEVLNVR